MEHDEAIRSHAAERYVSGDLPPGERSDFEAHFFDCLECAEDVRFELTFAANTRAVSREGRANIRSVPRPSHPGFRERWLGFLHPRPAMAFSIAANFVLAAGLGYVLLTGTRENTQPRFAQAYFAPGPTHGGDEDVHAIAARDTAYMARFLAPSPAGASYSYEILDAAGQRESSGDIPAPPDQRDFLYLQVPVQRLPGGVHTLVVRAAPGGEIVSWSRFRTSR